MKKENLKLVFVSPDAISFLEAVVFITAKMHKIDNWPYLVCADVIETDHFLKLILLPQAVSDDPQYSQEILLPYHLVLYVFSAQEKDLKRIRGFDNKTEGVGTPQRKPAR